MMSGFTGRLVQVASFLLLSAGLASAEGRLVVHGEGVVLAVPDMAEIRLGVVEEAGRASPAISGAVQKAAAMLAVLEEAGVAPEDVQTGALGLSPRYSSASNNRAPQIEGYQASYTIHVRLRDLTRMGEVLDPVLASGANRMDNLQLGIANPKPFEDEAETAAVRDAMDRAERLAEAAEMQLGELLELRLESASRPGPIMMQARAASVAEMAIAPGESEITARVVMEFALVEEQP